MSTLLLHPPHKLWEYNLNLLKGLIDILQLDIKLSFTEEYKKEHVGRLDCRQKLLPKNESYIIPNIKTIYYEQVFEDRQAFIPNACILDLLFCKGPEASLILERMIF